MTKQFIRAPLDPELIAALGRPIPIPAVGRSHCHKQIREVAREAAAELYETVMGDNAIRERWKEQNPGAGERELMRRFVGRNWPRCVPFARATLAQLLTSSTIDTVSKSQIMDVLTKDASLRVGRLPRAQIAQAGNPPNA